VLVQHRSDLAGRGSALIASELDLNRAQVENVQAFGLVERPLEPPPLHDIGEIEEGAGDGCAGECCPRR